jgi:dienelactone hydrolase
MKRRAVIERLTLIALLGCAFISTAYSEKISIPAPHLGDGKSLNAQFFVPEGKADKPRAAVILLHGCGGIGARRELNSRHAMWRDWLLARGMIVVFPESFTSRGVEQICTQKFSGRSIRQRDRVNDVMATRQWLLERSDVDAKKLLLWGWSNGGGTVLAAVTMFDRPGSAAYDQNPPDGAFAQAISFYPGCTNYAASARSQKLAAPLTLLIGEADDWTPAAPCKTWVDMLRASKQDARIVTYPGAFHDFDNPNGKIHVRSDVPNGVKSGQGVTTGPDPAAREDAKKRIDALLRERGLTAANAMNNEPSTRPKTEK